MLSWGFDFFPGIKIIKFGEVFHQQYLPNVTRVTQTMFIKTMATKKIPLRNLLHLHEMVVINNI